MARAEDAERLPSAGAWAALRTLFPYCMTWLVLVWDFTSWYCLWRVSLVKSSCKDENMEVL